MSLTRRVFGGAAQLTVANGVARAMGMAMLPILTRLLSPDVYGNAALASTLISLASMIALIGMDISYARAYLSQSPPNGDAAEVFAWRFALGASAVGAVAGGGVWLLYTGNQAPIFRSLAPWIVAGIAGSLLLVMAQARARLHGHYLRLAIAVAGGGCGASLLTVTAARWFLPNEHALLLGYIAAYLGPLCIVGIPSPKRLLRPSGLTPAQRRAVALVGLPAMVTAPMYWVISSADRWFLHKYASAAELGVYAVAYSIGIVGMMANSAIMAIWLPEATRIHESGQPDAQSMLGRMMSRLIMAMSLIWLMVTSLSHELIAILVSPRFAAAADYIPWIAAGVFFYGCNHLANTGLFLGRRLSWSAIIWTVVGVASLGANRLLVPGGGALAAARVQFASFAVIAVVAMVLAHRMHPLHLGFARLGASLAWVAFVGVALYRYVYPVPWLSAAIKAPFLVLAALVALMIVAPDWLERGRLALARALRFPDRVAELP